MQIRVSTDFITVASTTQGIQEALDDLPPDGGTVFIPRGIYEVSTTINVPNYATIIGQGRSTVVKAAGGTNIDVFTLIADIHDVIIRDLVVNGQADNNPTTGVGINCLDGNINCLFENLEMTNCRESCILIDSPTTKGSMIMNNCYVHDTQSSCMESGSGCNDTRITNNLFTTCGEHAIRIRATSNRVVIANNVIRDCLPGLTGINAKSCFHSTITGNTIETCGSGITLKSLTQCIVTGNAVYEVTADGIVMDDVHFCTVTGNSLIDCDIQGIDIKGGGKQNIIIGNICMPNIGASDYGIQVANTEEDVVIANNMCAGNTVGDIVDDGGTNITISHNVTKVV
jgi:parallel beta-helix repeat protein